MQAGKAGSTAPGQAGNALFLSQLRRGSCTRGQVGSAYTLTVQARNPVPTKCTKRRGGIQPSALVQSGNRVSPKIFQAGGTGHCSVHAGNHGPLPQCLSGRTLRPNACWGRATTPPNRTTLFALQRSARGGSPGQPAARGSAGALLLFTHSLLRPRGRHRDCCLHTPQFTADELGPGPSPESRPVGPAAGHAGIWSPPPTRFLESPSGGELSAPQSSAWFALAGSTSFWEERVSLQSLPERRVFFCFVFLISFPPPSFRVSSPLGGGLWACVEAE